MRRWKNCRDVMSLNRQRRDVGPRNPELELVNQHPEFTNSGSAAYSGPNAKTAVMRSR